MGIFGWSYPAGCSGPPIDDEGTECPICGEANADEDGVPVYPENPVFCTSACAEEGARRAALDAEADRMAAEDLEAEAELPLDIP
jgi:hypothetical protein